MTDIAQHLCLTCKLAGWAKTASGRLRPHGQGRCNWEMPHIPTPAAYWWSEFDRKRPIKAFGGYIERRPHKPITKCECYKERT
jgi:hypothetical protein